MAERHGWESPAKAKAAGRVQVRRAEAERKAAQRAADKASFKAYEEHCREHQAKREARAQRIQEMRQIDAQRAQIRRKYQ